MQHDNDHHGHDHALLGAGAAVAIATARDAARAAALLNHGLTDTRPLRGSAPDSPNVHQ